jgi:hypothetical protein
MSDPDTADRRAKILAAALALARLLGDDWVGSVEIFIYRGGVRGVEIRERVHP